MKHFILPLLLISTASLMGCQDRNITGMSDYGQSDKVMTETSAAPATVMESKQARMLQASTPKQGAQVNAPQAEMLLAYRYNFQFSIPAKHLEAVSQKAIQTCQNAGPDKCRVVSSSLNKYSDDQISSNIELRVQPDWFETYQEALAADSKAANGKLTSSNVSAEDLTIAISDSGARLKSLKTLRTRLENMLETRGSRLSDLIQVERELARVQGQIESSTARLRVLRTRVSMSQVHIHYATSSVAVTSSSFTPIKYALNEFIGTVARGFASVIRFIAILLPWLVVGLPLLWFLLRWRKKRKTAIKGKTLTKTKA